MDLSKLLTGGALFSMLETFGIDKNEIATKAKAGVIQMLADEETEQGAPVFAIFTTTEDKQHLLLSMYTAKPGEGLKKYKDVDLSDPTKLLEFFTNDNSKPNAGQLAAATEPTDTATAEPASDATA